jgi:formylglycine-generating enzyme required for sulfatase activity
MGVIKPLDAVRRDIPRRYARAVMRAMAAKPEERWPSWAALLEELTVSQRSPLRALAGVGITGVVLAAIGLYLKYRAPEVPEAPPPASSQPQPRFRQPAVPALPVPSSSDFVPTVSKSALVAGMVASLSRFRERLDDGSAGPIMVVIPAGEFVMGSPPTEAAREPEEGPQHKVVISRFALAQTEVTFDEYDRFARATQRALPNDAGWGRGTRPVINVSWADATAYTEWLSTRSDAVYRLPTEAEWEYAARAGTETPFSTGNCISAKQANFDHRTQDDYAACSSAAAQFLGSTQPVGSFPANPFGLRDMHGNVYEWVQDCYYEDYSDAPDDGRARLKPGTGSCSRRVLRGGSWNFGAGFQRSANRSGQRSEVTVNLLGFRLARTL